LFSSNAINALPGQGVKGLIRHFAGQANVRKCNRNLGLALSRNDAVGLGVEAPPRRLDVAATPSSPDFRQ
jgi:hypothetical protein